MSVKQDRQGARTVPQLEQKYNFGKTFAEVMGYAENAQKSAETAQAAADRANEAYAGLNQEQIFNLLTNNGQAQGIYRGEDGQIYINASYLVSGIIDAAVVQVVNLIAEKLKSISGTSVLNIDGAELNFFSGNNKTVQLWNASSSAERCLPIFYMTDFENGSATNAMELTPHHIKLGGNSLAPKLEITVRDGVPEMFITGDTKYRTLSWKDNGDGTFSLIGR